MNEVNEFVRLFKEFGSVCFSDINYCPYPDNRGGEICVEYNGMGFSIQLYEDDGEITIDLALTRVTINEFTFEQDELHFTHEWYSCLGDYKSIGEAVQCTMLEILTCDAIESYSKIFRIIKDIEKRLSCESFEAFTNIIKTCY